MCAYEQEDVVHLSSILSCILKCNFVRGPVARAEVQLQEHLAPSLALGLRLVGSFHFLKATIWVEYVDYEGNWSNGLSRSLAADQFVVDRGFETDAILPEMAWWSEPLLAVWNRLTLLLSEQALG